MLHGKVTVLQTNYLDKITCLIMVLLFRFHLRKQIPHVIISFKRLCLEKYSLPHVMISFNRLHLEVWLTPCHGYFNVGTPITPIKKCHDNITNNTMSWLAYIKYTQKITSSDFQENFRTFRNIICASPQIFPLRNSPE